MGSPGTTLAPGTHLGSVVQVCACHQLPQPFLPSLLAGVTGRIIPHCGMRALGSVHHPSVLLLALISRDLIPQPQQLRGSRKTGGLGPSTRGLGGLEKSCSLHLAPVAFIQVEISSGCLQSLPGAG